MDDRALCVGDEAVHRFWVVVEEANPCPASLPPASKIPETAARKAASV